MKKVGRGESDMSGRFPPRGSTRPVRSKPEPNKKARKDARESNCALRSPKRGGAAELVLKDVVFDVSVFGEKNFQTKS